MIHNRGRSKKSNYSDTNAGSLVVIFRLIGLNLESKNLGILPACWLPSKLPLAVISEGNNDVLRGTTFVL